MGPVRVSIVGVGNCASSLVQGVHYYRDADPATSVPGLMHVDFGAVSYTHLDVYKRQVIVIRRPLLAMSASVAMPRSMSSRLTTSLR